MSSWDVLGAEVRNASPINANCLIKPSLSDQIGFWEASGLLSTLSTFPNL